MTDAELDEIEKRYADERIPAEAFHPGEYLADELRARGWTARHLAHEMTGHLETNTLTIELILGAPVYGAHIDQEFAAKIGDAFGTSADLWVNLDRAWHRWHELNDIKRLIAALRAERARIAAADAIPANTMHPDLSNHPGFAHSAREARLFVQYGNQMRDRFRAALRLDAPASPPRDANSPVFDRCPMTGNEIDNSQD